MVRRSDPALPVYGVKTLVWCEDFPTFLDAVAAEKRIKRWRRAWKVELIERQNAQWLDLYPRLYGEASAAEQTD